MPRICAWASEAPWADRPIPLLMRGDAASVKLDRAHVRCLAANAFLLNIRSLPGSPDAPEMIRGRAQEQGEDTFAKHSWARCFSQSHCDVSMHKVLSLIASLYFYSTEHMKHVEPVVGSGDDVIIIERLQEAGRREPEGDSSLAPMPSSSWATSLARVDSSHISVHTGGMESLDAAYFVDFANRFPGYKSIIPSATQEEVLFCMVPELQPCSLFCEAMTAGEAIIIRNVRRVSAYSGYLGTFRWEGFWRGPGQDPAPTPCGRGSNIDIMVMDAQVRPGSRIVNYKLICRLMLCTIISCYV